MKILTTLAAVLALCGCAGTPLLGDLMRPGDTLLIHGTAPLFGDRVGPPGLRNGPVVAERGRDRQEDVLPAQAAR